MKYKFPSISRKKVYDQQTKAAKDNASRQKGTAKAVKSRKCICPNYWVGAVQKGGAVQTTGWGLSKRVGLSKLLGGGFPKGLGCPNYWVGAVQKGGAVQTTGWGLSKLLGGDCLNCWVGTVQTTGWGLSKLMGGNCLNCWVGTV